VGAEYVVLDDLNNGAQKPVQIRFTGPDSRKLLEITNQLHGRSCARCRVRWTWA
jgi:HAE1 family hydrophobic/amphiphilic exporter-1